MKKKLVLVLVSVFVVCFCSGLIGCNKNKTAHCISGHVWNNGETTQEPTCTEKGIMKFTCSTCGETKAETISALGHTWNDGEITQEPTCTKTGIKTFTCSTCGETRIETISALGHIWNNGETTQEPTCTEKGIMKFTCSTCGEMRIEDFFALGHSWHDEEITQEPTCTKSGIKTFTCSNCQETKTEIINALKNNSYTKQPFIGVENYNGYISYGVIGYTIKFYDGTEKYISCEEYKNYGEEYFLHTWNDGEITQEPSCTEKGIKAFTCIVCGETRTEDISVLGHTWNDGELTQEPTCTESGVKTFSCSICGEILFIDSISELGHTWNNGEITQEPTCMETGIKIFTCLVCGEKENKDISALGHDYVETEYDTRCSRCNIQQIEVSATVSSGLTIRAEGIIYSQTWTATAIGGCGTLQYKFQAFTNNYRVEIRQDFSTNNVFSFTYKTQTDYIIRITVKDEYGNTVVADFTRPE